MIEEVKQLIRNNAPNEDLIAAVTKASAIEKERNSVQGKHHKKALCVYEVTGTCNRSLSRSIVSSLNCGKSKMKRGVTNIIVDVNIYVEIVLIITRIIVTIVINVGHQVIRHVDVTRHLRETKCDCWCWAPNDR